MIAAMGAGFLNLNTKLISFGARPEKTRSILPNSLKTEIVAAMNLREWRYFLKLRTTKEAYPQMREITLPMLRQFKEKLPIIFNDIELA
jgi:thymidylate synthase (FAD)